MNISGIGIVSTRGRGVESYQAALQEGWRTPSYKDLSTLPGAKLPVFEVDKATLTDRAVLKKFRRADRFTKMAALAAWDAVRDSGIDWSEEKSSLGIILATGFGPHVTTFRYLDEIITYGEKNVSPITFSHAVHNTAAGYISLLLGNRGPTLTITQFFCSFHHALILAGSWLREGRCKYVLVGSVDECGEVMENVCAQKLKIASDGKIKPFQFSKDPEAVPGEGSVFFFLTSGDTSNGYCRINNVSLDKDGRSAEQSDISILETDGLSEDETIYRDILPLDNLVAGYAPIFGSIVTGSSFQCAAGALMLKNQVRYACPILDNPHGLNLCQKTEPAHLNTINCIRYDCSEKKGTIELGIKPRGSYL